MTAREDTLDIIPNDFMRFVKNGRVIKGTWKKIENHKIYADYLGKQLGYETREDWYKITTKDFYNNFGSSLLKNKYSHSPIMFLKGVFTDTEWLPWKLESGANNNFWNDKENHMKYAIWLGKELGYKIKDDWYKINVKDFRYNHGWGLIQKHYNCSPLMFLNCVFPDTEWLSWKLGTQTPQCFWNDEENHIKYVDWLGKEIGYKNKDDWYQITRKTINNNYGGGLLMKYNGSPQKLLNFVYPNIEWFPWKFRHSGNGFWNDKENHVKYANWFMNEFNFKTMEDWYKTNRIALGDNHGGGLLFAYYKGSMELFATTIYPDYPWDLSKFKKNYSQGQIEWLNYLSIKKYLDVRHALNHNEGEYSIPNSRYHADGYSETENMILEYHGDFWHGNPEIYNQEELNTVTKTTYGEQYIKTLKKQRFCEESGYNFISIWESEWFRFKNSIIQLQRIFKKKQEANV